MRLRYCVSRLFIHMLADGGYERQYGYDASYDCCLRVMIVSEICLAFVVVVVDGYDTVELG